MSRAAMLRPESKVHAKPESEHEERDQQSFRQPYSPRETG